MKRVVVLQHVAVETLGSIEASLVDAQLAFQYVRPFLGETVPGSLDGIPGLIVLGGPMGVYEVDRYPYLLDEMRLIELAVEASIPILGICLGSQLLAHVLGARVQPGEQKEIGWHEIQMEAEAASDAIWRDAPRTFTACHWHGDVFDLPRGAQLLARSALTPHQAFRYGNHAYGTLFHIETTETLLRDMISQFADELRGGGLSGEHIASEAAAHFGALRRIGRGVFDRWGQLVHREP